MMVIDHGDGTYSLASRQRWTRDQLEALCALADFPLWSAQPDRVVWVCAALHNAVGSVAPASAEALNMVPVTTVN